MQRIITIPGFRQGLRLLVCISALSLTPTVSHGAWFTDWMMKGQDPAIIYQGGYYYLAQSDGCNVRVRTSPTLSGLPSVSNAIRYSPGCNEIWAPEIHSISNKWYIYYTMNTNLATGGVDRRGFVAEATSAAGPYVSRGILFADYWNIDGSVFTWNNQLYYIFSGEPVSGAQKIFIAPMSNPYTLSAAPTAISAPVQSWETVGTPDVNEGPWGFVRGNQLFIVYSASGCWTDNYCLGLLTLTGTNPLSASSWTKTGPVFSQQAGAYGPGHNSVVQDGQGQWWNMYHANTNSGQGCDGDRRIRAQRLFWKSNGAPDFGSPVPDGSLIDESTNFFVAWFPLLQTSGTNVANSALPGNATVGGGATWANPGLRFNGIDSFLDCGPQIGNDVQHQLTLAAWVRPESFNDWAGIITKGTNVCPYAMQLWSDGSVRFTANWGAPPGASGSGSWNSTAKLSLNQWQHVAITYDGDRIRFYINGVLDSNQPLVALRFGVANEPLYLGADFPGGDEYFKGSIRSARVYGRVLSAPEIFALENFPPTLKPVPNTNLVAGQTVTISAEGTDPNVPQQSLRYALLSAPPGSALGSLTGVYTWRPALWQAPATYRVDLSVSDNGTPVLSATQSFSIGVRLPVQPSLSAPHYDGTSLSFDVSGDVRLDYVVSESSNCLDWTPILITNPIVNPFTISLPITTNDFAGFFRVQNQ